MKTNKIYKINDKIENVDEVEEVAKGIVLKALKVIETKGNKWATRIIERKDVDTFEDLKQTVILKLFENDLKITKECYKSINKYLYNYKIENVKSVSIVIDENATNSNIDYKSYIEYLKNENTSLENKKDIKRIVLEKLELTEKQKEILNIYSKTKSYNKTAELLDVKKATVQTVVNRIRKKSLELIECVEY